MDASKPKKVMIMRPTMRNDIIILGEIRGEREREILLLMYASLIRGRRWHIHQNLPKPFTEQERNKERKKETNNESKRNTY